MAANAASTANIQNSFVKSNLYADATNALGNAMLASNRAGGVAPSALSGGFNNLASDLRTANFNHQQQLLGAAAQKANARMSLLGSVMGTAFDFLGKKNNYGNQGRLSLWGKVDEFLPKTGGTQSR
jgi:hypothetical protein